MTRRNNQMVEEDGRYFAPAEVLCGKQPAVPGDNPQGSVDEDRDVEAEGAYAARELTDLLGAVRPRICRIGPQRLDPPPDDREGRAGIGRAFSDVVSHDRDMLSESIVIVNIIIV